MTNWQLHNAQQALLARRRQARITYHPPILATQMPLPITPVCMPALAQPTPAACPREGVGAVRQLYQHGDIAVAAMAAGMSSYYQLWLALRHLDNSGRGWMDIATLKKSICAEVKRETFLYKPARLRQLIAEADGRFWQRDDGNGRLYIRNEAKIASELGISRLSGRHVAIEPEHIFTRIQQFRAYSYAAWLTTRENPISQATIQTLTGIPPRTQRRYCQLAGIKTHINIAVGSQATPDSREEALWNHNGVFEFIDFHGRQGPKMRRYVAWHLPTSYTTTPTCQRIGSTARNGSRGRQRRTNRSLADLGITRNQGNGQSPPMRLFFRNGAGAARQKSGDGQDRYWPGPRTRTGTKMWHVMQ